MNSLIFYALSLNFGYVYFTVVHASPFGLPGTLSTSGVQRVQRSAISTIWPNATVPYVFDKNFSKSGKRIFLEASKKVESNTCISFHEKTPYDTHLKYWIRVTHGDEKDCGESANGRQLLAKEGQDLKITTKCLNIGLMQHEIGHILGFPNEQDRADRDEYIEWNNDLPTCPKGETQKDVSTTLDQAALDIFYDYVSIMHNERQCVTAKLKGPITFSAVGTYFDNTYSVLDYEKLNAMYDCEGCRSYRFRDISQLAYYHNAFEAGKDKDGQTLYICRTYHYGSILIGKSQPDQDLCSIGTWDEEEKEGTETEYYANTQKFEVFTNPKKAPFVWMKRPNDFSIPEGAVVGGRTVERDPVYIAKCDFDYNKVRVSIPGTLYEGDKVLRVPHDGKVKECTDYYILVCHYLYG